VAQQATQGAFLWQSLNSSESESDGRQPFSMRLTGQKEKLEKASDIWTLTGVEL
jgi:hypothetical protein